MKSQFKVKTEYSDHSDEWGGHYSTLENVVPESVSLLCPRCNVYSTMRIDTIVDRPGWKFDLICNCSHCGTTVFVEAKYNEAIAPEEISHPDEDETTFIDYQPASAQIISAYPKSKMDDIPAEIPDKYRQDYIEAILVLGASPKASAAISRRILQNIIREEFKIKRRDLAAEIAEFVELKDVPSYLCESVDAIRSIGNLAAHPTKNESTGEIVEVEPGEAEWVLETLELLSDFAFVQPKRLAEMRRKLNQKLQAIGKPPIRY